MVSYEIHFSIIKWDAFIAIVNVHLKEKGRVEMTVMNSNLLQKTCSEQNLKCKYVHSQTVLLNKNKDMASIFKFNSILDLIQNRHFVLNTLP